MEYVASLDIGSETMVMAVGEKSDSGCHVLGVECVSTEGIRRGRIIDRFQVKECIQHLLTAFKRKHAMNIDSLKIAVPNSWLEQEEWKERVRFSSSKKITPDVLFDVEKKCRESMAEMGKQWVDMLPLAYYVDQMDEENPLGICARKFEVNFRVYVARLEYLNELKQLLTTLGIQQVEFYAMAHAYAQALVSEKGGERIFGLIDLGASSTNVLLFQHGNVQLDIELPLGCRTIDSDLNIAFSIRNMEKARQLKEEYGLALRVLCKKQEILIPDTKYCIKSQDLAYVVQCRLEELLEGALFQLRSEDAQNEYLTDEILLTGGGSRIPQIEVLLKKLSGQQVSIASAMALTAEKRSDLETPEFLVALGLLRCERKKQTKKESLLKKWMGEMFKES